MTRLLTLLSWLTTPGRYQSLAVGALFLAAVTVAEIDAADVGASLASLTLIQALREGRRKEGAADGDGDDLDGFTVPPDSLFASLRPLDVAAERPRTRARVRAADRASLPPECARLAAASPALP